MIIFRPGFNKEKFRKFKNIFWMKTLGEIFWEQREFINESYLKVQQQKQHISRCKNSIGFWKISETIKEVISDWNKLPNYKSQQQLYFKLTLLSCTYKWAPKISIEEITHNSKNFSENPKPEKGAKLQTTFFLSFQFTLFLL